MPGVSTDCCSDVNPRHRVLVVQAPGRLGALLCHALEEAGHEIRSATFDDLDDLFEQAIGCDTIVYAPAHNLLDAAQNPRPNVERAASVLRAANAPGVELIVLLVPKRGYEQEEDLIFRHGKPYFVIRSAPSIEEMCSSVEASLKGAIHFLPRREIGVSTDGEIGGSVIQVLDDERVGRVVETHAENQPLAHIAARGGARLAVPVPDFVWRFLRPDLSDVVNSDAVTALRLYNALGRSAHTRAAGESVRLWRRMSVFAVLCALGLPLVAGLGAGLWVVLTLTLAFSWPLVVGGGAVVLSLLALRHGFRGGEGHHDSDRTQGTGQARTIARGLEPPRPHAA